VAKTAIWGIATGLTAGLLLSSIAWPAKRVAKQFLNVGGKKPPGYTQVVKSPPGMMVFISGQGGAGADGKLPSDFSSQAKNTFENLSKCLELAGAGWKDVVKVNYFVTDMTNTGELRKVRAGYIDRENPPASTLVQAGLGAGMLIEVEAVAIVPD
jgi:enamine deaminase RidA (YjgF/YER057c/UK114 family)